MTTQSKRNRQGKNKTREEIGKGNQITALRFQTGGQHQTSPATLRGLQGVERNGYLQGLERNNYLQGLERNSYPQGLEDGCGIG